MSEHYRSSLDIDRNSPKPAETTGINLQHYAPGATAEAVHMNIDPSPLLEDGDRDPSEGLEAGQDTGESRGAAVSQGAGKADADAGADAGGGGDDDNALPAPEPPTWRHPVNSTLNFFYDLSGFFSWQFLSWLGVVQTCVSGGVFALVMSLGLPLFKQLGIGASRQQLYMTMIMSPWAMKPFIGVASDLFPIGGYNKKWFAFYSILIGLLGCVVLLAFYHGGAVKSAIDQGQDSVQHFADIAVICFTAVSYEASTLDILGEGKYSELMRLYPQSGSSIITYKFGWSLLGSLVTQMYVGPLSDAGHFHVLFWIALALAITPLYPTLVGWIPEKLRTSEEAGMAKVCNKWCLFDKGQYQEKKTPFILITLCGLAAPILAAVTTYADLAVGLAVSAVMIVGFTVATYYIFPRAFFWPFVAVVLFSMDWISMGSALGYYYTASEKCVPGGPNFNYTYYITVTGVVGSVVNFIAVILYQNTLSSWRFRPVLIFTIVIGSLASMVDVVIIMRWNLMLGIPDHVFFLLGNAIFENLIGILWSIPSSSIYAKMAPPGMESAVFAYTVGIANFCSMVSTLIGSGAIQWSGMKTLGDNCDFESLPYLIVLCQILIPMVLGIPACFLIPNVLQTEHLIDWEKEGWYEDRTRETEGPGSGQDREGHESEKDGFAEDSRIESHLL